MGLLSKLFLNSRLKFTSKTPQSSEVVFQPQLANHQFDKENIRFIIFRDHDLKGRSVLFDSLKDGISDQTKISRSSSDLKKLADMMFGTLPLSNKTTTFKVHSIKSPPQLMITKVFIPQPRSRESTYSDLDSFDLYSIESLSTDDHIRTEPQEIRSYPELARQEAAHSMPMDVPLRAFGGAMCHADDMELLTSASGTHSPGAPSGGSVACLSSSYSSKDRRMRRHKTTMIHLFPNSRNEDKIDPIPIDKRPTKIGIAVIFILPEENSPVNRCFQSFFFSHIMLIENYVHQLKGAIDQALAKRSQKELICQAIAVFLNAMSSLYTAPRLKDPAWLSMMTYTTRRFTLSSQFLDDFKMLVEKCYTKNTKFFLGVLITAVLTHHLSWAPTVAPVDERPSHTYLDKHAAKWANSLVRSHPYNPLWAQLGDLYGAVGVPVCLSRTVVVGKKQELVSTVLFILSYFIRCSEILENVESFPDFAEAYNHSCSSSETSSIVHEDEVLLKSPPPYPKERSSSSMSESASNCTASMKPGTDLSCVKKSYSKMQDLDGSDLDGCQYFPGVCHSALESAAAPGSKTGLTPLMLFVEASDSCLSQIPLNSSRTPLSSPPVERLNSPGEASCSSLPGKKNKSILTVQPCRLKEDYIVESPKIAFEQKIGCASNNTNRSTKVLHRVPIGGQADALNFSIDFEEKDDSLQVLNPSEAVELRPSSSRTSLLRGNSMFDEYFVPGTDLSQINIDRFYGTGTTTDRDVNPSEAAELRPSIPRTLFLRGNSMFDEYFVPGTDISQINIDHLSRTSTTIDTGLGFEESTQLYSEHFGAVEIEDVVGLPDGPSKQILHMAISKLQDRFMTSGLVLEDDHLCLNGEGMHDHVDRSINSTKPKKKRHGSGQSLTMSSSRCRSVTLSESSQKRNDMTDYIPVPMPSSSELPTGDVASGCIYLSEECNFGRSLLGDYCSAYTSHFVLHGTSDREFLREPYTLLHEDLKTSVQNSVLDEPVAESTCIVADTDNWNVQLFSCKSKSPDEPLNPLPLISSPLVCNLIESVYELAKLKMSPEFCLLHLEDQLQSIYLKSRRLAEYIRVCRKVYSQELATLLSLDISDMPLLLAVARTHSPQLFRNL